MIYSIALLTCTIGVQQWSNGSGLIAFSGAQAKIHNQAALPNILLINVVERAP